MSENQFNQLDLAQIQAAHRRKSRLLSKMTCQLARQPRYPETEQITKGTLTFEDYLKLRNDYHFQQLSSSEKKLKRQQLMEQLESIDAAIALPESLKVHEFLLELWHSPAEHPILCRLLKIIPFNYGAWRGIKQIFKQAEITQNWVVYGVILARLDSLAADSKNNYEITLKTADYLVRRGWRTIRQSSDLHYAAAMAEVLRHYPSQFKFKTSTIIIRAFSVKAENIKASRCFEHRLSAWQSQISCLLTLVAEAENTEIRQSAIETLKQHCKAQLRQLPASQLLILAQRQNALIDEFLIWLLQSDPRFEQSRLQALGLHELCLNLLKSNSNNATEYAVAYTKVYGRNLTLNQLLPLLDSNHKAVYQLAQALVAERDPKKDFSFDDWGKMLETEQGYKQASLALITHYPLKQFSHDWLIARLQAVESLGFTFACELIEQKEVELSPTEYLNLLLNKASPEFGDPLITFVFSRLNLIELSSLKDSALLQSMLLMDDNVTGNLMNLIKTNKLTLQFWSVDFLKSFVDDTNWQQSSNWTWLAKQRANFTWGNQIAYSPSLVETILKYLGDVRCFDPKELGFDWLLGLTEHQNALLVGFASGYLNRVFRPADFAPSKTDEPTLAKKAKISVDLILRSFLFTGKLATMTRDEATDKVTAAGGINAKGVTKTLDYLVIGDEGSSLYGEGAKGSKQVKAEQWNAKGANISIISETAFLQILVGKTMGDAPDAVNAGCDQIWQLLTQSKKQSRRQFALAYVQQHHTELSKTYLGRPADSGAQIPNTFFTLERIAQLFSSQYLNVRALGVELAKWHLHEWTYDLSALFMLCLHSDPAIASLILQGFTCENKPENRYIHLNPQAITINHLLLLCENRAIALRQLGLYLLQTHQHLQQPNELLSLLESADPKIRAAVIRLIAKANCSENRFELASDKQQTFLLLLRRALFEIPPSRGKPESKHSALKFKLKPLPARDTKRKLLETLRDVAIEQIQLSKPQFAHALMPLLEEFSQSRGQSEFSACLVAQTRISHALASFAEKGKVHS